VALKRLLTWRGLDFPRMELAEVELGSDGLSARGVQIGTSGVAQGDEDGQAVDVPGRYRLDYELETGPDLVTTRIALTARAEDGERRLDLRRAPDGAWQADTDLPDLSGALDCDLGLSPLTNFMPAQREDIPRGGEAKEFVMAWIAVPSLAVHRSEQRYEPIDETTVRYVGRHRSFEGELELDEDGFVVRYPGLGVRVSMESEWPS
jgi:uncharacterized protein